MSRTGNRASRPRPRRSSTHCVRAIDKGTTAGAHGLPLMGTGDWNDGMNRVGAGGRGESTWLGFFLHTVLTTFAPLCRARNDSARADRYTSAAKRLAVKLERSWDGEWYTRGYYDDGSPLGSAQNDECRIDSIAQSWAVLSGAVPLRFAERAMDAVRTVARHARIADAAAPASAVRSVGAGSWLHQRVSAGRPGERRPVHACRRVDRDGPGAARKRRRGGGTLPHAEPDQPQPHGCGRRLATRRSRT